MTAAKIATTLGKIISLYFKYSKTFSKNSDLCILGNQFLIYDLDWTWIKNACAGAQEVKLAADPVRFSKKAIFAAVN